ncbi:unnamed protein product, partial [Meganyctiphanes norvegica]
PSNPNHPNCGNVQPTGIPTEKSTVNPTEKPIVKPTGQPTDKPTEDPIVKPTGQPTDKPTAKPTGQPTVKPTEKPTENPNPSTNIRPYCDKCGTSPVSLARSDSDQRIVGGQQATPGEYPWQVLLRITTSSSGEGRCGGSIIKKRWILSASHCFTGEYIGTV